MRDRPDPTGRDGIGEESEAYRRGMERRDLVMGPAGGRRRRMMRALHPDLERHLVGHAWGEVNARPGLDVKTRELITVGSLQAKILFIPAHTAGHVAYWTGRVPAADDKPRKPVVNDDRDIRTVTVVASSVEATPTATARGPAAAG